MYEDHFAVNIPQILPQPSLPPPPKILGKTEEGAYTDYDTRIAYVLISVLKSGIVSLNACIILLVLTLMYSGQSLVV